LGESGHPPVFRLAGCAFLHPVAELLHPCFPTAAFPPVRYERCYAQTSALCLVQGKTGIYGRFQNPDAKETASAHHCRFLRAYIRPYSLVPGRSPDQNHWGRRDLPAPSQYLTPVSKPMLLKKRLVEPSKLLLAVPRVMFCNFHRPVDNTVSGLQMRPEVLAQPYTGCMPRLLASLALPPHPSRLTWAATEPRAARAWGNEGHRIINRLAASTLPADCRPFCAQPAALDEIEYLGPEPDRWRSPADRS